MNEYICKCTEGYTGSACEVDIDESLAENLAGLHSFKFPIAEWFVSFVVFAMILLIIYALEKLSAIFWTWQYKFMCISPIFVVAIFTMYAGTRLFASSSFYQYSFNTLSYYTSSSPKKVYCYFVIEFYCKEKLTLVYKNGLAFEYFSNKRSTFSTHVALIALNKKQILFIA